MFEAGSVTSPSNVADAPLASSDDQPQPGELKIKERRSWKTWQLLTAILVATIFGMWINGDTGGGSSANGSSSGSSKLPPESAASSGSAAGGSTARPRQPPVAVPSPRPPRPADPRRPLPPAGPRRRQRTSSTSSSAAAGPARVLLTLATAPRQLDQHAVHNDCRPMEHRLGLQVRPCPGRRSVVPGVRDPDRVAAHRNGRDQRDRSRRGSRSRPQSSLGAQTLVVQAPASCTWIVKVTGS